jgi:hypothetical protein
MVNADSQIAALETASGYTFTNKLYGAKALQMDGVPGHVHVQGVMHVVEKNTLIAVFGDSVMATVLCEKWLKDRIAEGIVNHTSHVLFYTDLHIKGMTLAKGKGDWTYLRQLLNNVTLPKVGFAHGIDALILKSPGTTSASDNMVSTTMEAICGAAFLDAVENGQDGEDRTHGLDVVRSIMERFDLFNHTLLQVT